MQYSCPVIYDSIPIIHQNQFFQNQRLCKQTYVQGQQTKEVVLLWHTITNDLWEREEGPRMYGKMMRILKLSGGVSGGHRTVPPSWPTLGRPKLLSGLDLKRLSRDAD